MVSVIVATDMMDADPIRFRNNNKIIAAANNNIINNNVWILQVTNKRSLLREDLGMVKKGKHSEKN